MSKLIHTYDPLFGVGFYQSFYQTKTSFGGWDDNGQKQKKQAISRVISMQVILVILYSFNGIYQCVSQANNLH